MNMVKHSIIRLLGITSAIFAFVLYIALQIVTTILIFPCHFFEQLTSSCAYHLGYDKNDFEGSVLFCIWRCKKPQRQY